MNQTRARILAWATATARSKADREALARVTARLKPAPPTPRGFKLDPLATKLWSQQLAKEFQKSPSFFSRILNTNVVVGKRAGVLIMDDIVDGLVLDPASPSPQETDDMHDALKYACQPIKWDLGVKRDESVVTICAV